MPHRLTIAGGSRISDEAAVARILSSLDVSAYLWNGETGAPAIGYRWALAAGIPVEMFLRDRRRLLFWQSVRDRDRRLMREGKPTLAIIFPPLNETGPLVDEALAGGVRVRYEV